MPGSTHRFIQDQAGPERPVPLRGTAIQPALAHPRASAPATDPAPVITARAPESATALSPRPSTQPVHRPSAAGTARGLPEPAVIEVRIGTVDIAFPAAAPVPTAPVTDFSAYAARRAYLDEWP